VTNPHSKQTFFYQIRLAAYRGAEVGAAAGFAPAWFFSGRNEQNGLLGQFGFGDNITTYGQPFAPTGRWTSYRIDTTERIKALIAEGVRFGMDQDLSNWILTGTYHGSTAMGHVLIEGEWRGFALGFK
jgi:hypothetical protein